MTARELDKTFQRFANDRGVDLMLAPFEIGMSALIEFYAIQRFSDCDLSADGDMLLYQWGTNQWAEPPSFELDLTRQIIFSDATDDEAIWQMHLTYHFGPTERTGGIEAGDCWLSNPEKAQEFAASVMDSAAIRAVIGQKPTAVSVSFECAG
jgi:hypothetical protein